MKALVLHGGAGDRDLSLKGTKLESEWKESIEAALDAGYEILSSGGHALDAVEKAITLLEDFPCFNAGIGAALNDHGEAELDAGIMDGRDLRAGAVSCVKTIRNPIKAARCVMDSTLQVFYVSQAAEELASRMGLKMVENSFFVTDAVRAKYNADILARTSEDKHRQEKVVLGTVGAVALDSQGNLAAGNSTGGIMHKPAGRVGDTPIVGAGMYARNDIAAIACTGHGEYFIRTVAAHEVASLMRYKQYSLERALEDVIQEITSLGGRGGMIGVDAKGNISMKHSTSSMVRAAMQEGGKKIVEVW